MGWRGRVIGIYDHRVIRRTADDALSDDRLIVDCASAKDTSPFRDIMGVASGTRTMASGRMEMATPGFRLWPIMKRTAAGIPETWTRYPSVDDARAGAKLMYHNDRVLRVMAVNDSVGSFVESIER